MSYENNIKKCREAKNIMAKDVAEGLQITYRNYQRYEKGLVDIPASKLIALADYFNVSLDYLVGRSDVMKRR